MLILPQLMIPRAPSLIAPANNAVRLYDGATRVILRTQITPVVDNAVLLDGGMVSFWVRYLTGGFLRFHTEQSSSDPRGSRVEVSSTGILYRANDVSGVLVNSISVAGIPDGEWGHVMIAWNNTSTPRTATVYVNNVLRGSTTSSNSNVYFKRGFFNINGHQDQNSGESSVELYDFWLFENAFDLTDASVRAKFINPSTLKPVPLGADGTAPGYGQPRVFYSGNVSGWRQNKGSLVLPELEIIGNVAAFGAASSTP